MARKESCGSLQTEAATEDGSQDQEELETGLHNYYFDGESGDRAGEYGEEVNRLMNSYCYEDDGAFPMLRETNRSSYYSITEEKSKPPIGTFSSFFLWRRSKTMQNLCGYEVHETIGRGVSCKVKRGFCSDQRNSVALKIIEKKNSDSKLLKLIDREIQALSAVDHPHVVKLFSSEEMSYPGMFGLPYKQATCLVLEYCRGGVLMDLLAAGALPETVARTYFHQLLTALDYLHSRNLYHRDIKPENILLGSDFQLKLGDFGFAKAKEDHVDLMSTECGTAFYVAPEVLRGEKYKGDKADVWSAGITLFLMFSGNPPLQLAHSGDVWFQLLSENTPMFWKAHMSYFPGFTEVSPFTPLRCQRHIMHMPFHCLVLLLSDLSGFTFQKFQFTHHLFSLINTYTVISASCIQGAEVRPEQTADSKEDIGHA